MDSQYARHFDKKSDAYDEECIDHSSLSVGEGVNTEHLSRKLSARQINMITIGGVIGTGLFLGTGKSLATGGPLSLLLAYGVIAILVFLTMLALGEMATQYPVAGSFCTYAKRFGSESLGFAILTNYAFNDMMSVASDLTAIQIVWAFWDIPTSRMPYWGIALIFWFVLLILNVIDVRLYGEAEYWLAILKVISVIIFFIISIVVNAGHNNLNGGKGEYIGFKYWSQGDAPFVGGFGGFASVFVTAAFAYGGTESITLTAGETKNPVRVIPKTIKAVFFRILFFYIFTCFFIGMNVPYDYPGLNTKSVITSPFTIVFTMVGAKAGGTFMNVVIMTSVISAGNHALYAGARLMYTLGTQGYFPKVFTRVNRLNIPYVGVIAVWFVGGLGFGASFIGAHATVWSWLQSIVGLSNMISWLVINIISIRFRMGLKKQGKEHILLYRNWTYPWGPWFATILSIVVILVQGWSVFAPWSVVDFCQSYLEIPVFIVCLAFWKGKLLWDRWRSGEDPFAATHNWLGWIKLDSMDFETDTYVPTAEEEMKNERLDSLKGWPRFKATFADNFL
ncbi:general amino acid permease Agp3p [Diutina catenulata]